MKTSTLAITNLSDTTLCARMHIATFKAYGIATLSTLLNTLYRQLKLWCDDTALQWLLHYKCY